jgi:hypothetical protein
MTPDRLGSLALRAMVAAHEDDRNIGSQLPDLPRRSMMRLAEAYLPRACVLHPWPSPFWRQTRQVGARRANFARRDLWGRSAMSVLPR